MLRQRLHILYSSLKELLLLPAQVTNLPIRGSCRKRRSLYLRWKSEEESPRGNFSPQRLSRIKDENLNSLSLNLIMRIWLLLQNEVSSALLTACGAEGDENVLAYSAQKQNEYFQPMEFTEPMPLNCFVSLKQSLHLSAYHDLLNEEHNYEMKILCIILWKSTPCCRKRLSSQMEF